jgi:flagellar hook-associated protein 3 FlgL
MSRITNKMITNNYLSDMQTNLKGLSKLQGQLATGKTISRGSDDPNVATRLMQLNSEISANKQYNSNITDTTNWLDTTDTALSEGGNVLSRIRELMVKAGNGAYGSDEIKSIKNEVVADVQQFAQTLNTSFDGSYVFGGTKSASKPVTVDSNGTISYADKNGSATTDATTIAQIGSDLTAQISEGVTVNYNKTATDILEFHDNGLSKDIDVKSTLSTIIANLSKGAKENGETDTQSQAALSDINGTNLKDLDAIINNLLQARSEVGTMQNRMESANTTNEDQNYNMTSILSSSGDVDLTEKTVEYSSMQTVYTAALQTSSKVIQKTILDYI